MHPFSRQGDRNGVEPRFEAVCGPSVPSEAFQRVSAPWTWRPLESTPTGYTPVGAKVKKGRLAGQDQGGRSAPPPCDRAEGRGSVTKVTSEPGRCHPPGEAFSKNRVDGKAAAGEDGDAC